MPVASARAPPAASGLLWSLSPRALACRRPAAGGMAWWVPALEGKCPSGPAGPNFPPVCRPGPGPLLAGCRFGIRTLSPCCPRSRRHPAVLRGGGGGAGQRSVVSGQRVRGTSLPRASACPMPLARAQLAASPPAHPRHSWSPGSGMTLALLMSCCADCRGGGCSGSGGRALPGGDLGPSVRSQPPELGLWGPRLGLQAVGPLPSGLAVTCASVCESRLGGFPGPPAPPTPPGGTPLPPGGAQHRGLGSSKGAGLVRMKLKDK